MPSGVRRKAAKRAGRDIHHDKKEQARKRKMRKEQQIKRALKSNPVIEANWDHSLTLTQK